MQGVIKSYDPLTGDGVVVCDTVDLSEYDLAANALEGSLFRMLRQGQRVIFDLDERGCACSLRLTRVRFGGAGRSNIADGHDNDINGRQQNSKGCAVKRDRFR